MLRQVKFARPQIECSTLLTGSIRFLKFNLFHIVLECEGMPAAGGSQAATDINEEFTYRHWYQNVICTWDGRTLRLEADNDYDDNGLALLDEFSDAMVICVGNASYQNLRVVEVSKF